jgi:hypothetical protein
MRSPLLFFLAAAVAAVTVALDACGDIVRTGAYFGGYVWSDVPRATAANTSVGWKWGDVSPADAVGVPDGWKWGDARV